MNVDSSLAAGHLKMGERVAHDAALANQSPDAQLAPDLHGIAAARRDPCIQILLMSVEQAGARTTSYPIREVARAFKTAYRAMVDVLCKADPPDGPATAMAANDLVVTFQPVLAPSHAVTLGGREDRLGGHHRWQDRFDRRQLARLLLHCFPQLACATHQRPLDGVAQVG